MESGICSIAERLQNEHLKIDEIVKSLWISAGWLSKKAHIQGVVIFQGRDYTFTMSSSWKNLYNAGDETFYDDIKIYLNHDPHQFQ